MTFGKTDNQSFHRMRKTTRTGELFVEPPRDLYESMVRESLFAPE